MVDLPKERFVRHVVKTLLDRVSKSLREYFRAHFNVKNLKIKIFSFHRRHCQLVLRHFDHKYHPICLRGAALHCEISSEPATEGEFTAKKELNCTTTNRLL